MDIDLINEAYNFLDDIKSLDEYQKMMDLKNQINVEYKDLIDIFNEAKRRYEEVSFSTYHPDFKKCAKDLSQIKEELYSKELVKQYFYYQREVQKHLDDLSKELKSIIRNG